jgi:transposase
MSKIFHHLEDKQWGLIEPMIINQLPLERGTPRSNMRKVWNSIFYVLIHGCRWIDLPRDKDYFIPKSTAHRWIKVFSKLNLLEKVLSNLLQIGLKKEQIDLKQIAVDGSFSPNSRRRRGNRVWL